MKSLDLTRFYASGSDLPFENRWAVMPLRASMPLAAEDIEKNWQLLQKTHLYSYSFLRYSLSVLWFLPESAAQIRY